MIPPFEPATGLLPAGTHEATWEAARNRGGAATQRLLPAGTHEATWEELVARFGWTPHRLALLAGLKAALDALRAAGCRRAYVDGSFVTAKEEPGDFDACWEPDGVAPRCSTPSW